MMVLRAWMPLLNRINLTDEWMVNLNPVSMYSVVIEVERRHP